MNDSSATGRANPASGAPKKGADPGAAERFCCGNGAQQV